MPWRIWAGLAATAAVAAAASFILLRGEPAELAPSQHNLEGRGVVVARNGGVLRWRDRKQFDLGLAGSVWIAKDDSSPTLPGEFLHSSAPSSVHMQLPGGGRLTAGPLASLAVGEGDSIALLDGALTATAGAKASLVVETPAGRVETTGAVEVSVRTVSDAKSGQAWLGAWPESRRPGAAPAPAAPRATVAVYAREGTVEVAAASGPVRNSLERHVHVLKQGQALVMSEAKVYTLGVVDDDAPPEQPSMLGGLPVPPDSQFLPAAAPAPAPPPSIGASGPVRNSLERVMADATTDPAARAYALSVFEGVGGAEAVDAAAKAAEDPAVMVRSAAVRILALNASADRPKALAALRRLAMDKDEGVAVFAIRALLALEDRACIPILLPMVVDDDAPPESGSAPASVQVAAFQTLVYFGDTSRLAAAASHLVRLDPDREPGILLQTTLDEAFQKMPPEKVREYLADPRPGVRAAALFASKDLDAAKSALGDAAPVVRLAAAGVVLIASPSVEFDSLRPLVSGSPEVRTAFLHRVQTVGRVREWIVYPDWLREAAARQLVDSTNDESALRPAVSVLKGGAPEGLFEQLLASGTPKQKRAILVHGNPAPGLVLAALGDGDPGVRREAAARLPGLAGLPAESVSTEALLAALEKFAPDGFAGARLKAAALSILARARNAEGAVQSLLGMAVSGNPVDRRAAVYGLGPLGARAEAAAALERLLLDKDREVAEAASDYFARTLRRPGWVGHTPAQIFPIASPHPVVRAQVALAALASGTTGVREALHKELAEGSSSVRMRILHRSIDHEMFLDFVELSVVRDPEPAVRWRLLLATRGPAQAEAARALADDPAFWVRGTALALLAKSGDGAALDGLRTLLRERQQASEADPHLAGLEPESDTLPDSMLDRSRMAVGAPRAALQAADPGSGFEMTTMANLTLARRLIVDLGNPVDPEIRTAAAAGLGDCPTPKAVGALVGALDPLREPEARVREAAAKSLNRLLGFDPGPDAKAWWTVHRAGFVGDNDDEVRARDAR
jgi:HEAT repeat protein